MSRSIHRGSLLTAQDLRDRHFGPTLVARFTRLFPEGAPLTKEAMLTMAAHGIPPSGLLAQEDQYLYDALSAPEARRTYVKRIAPAAEAFKRTRDVGAYEAQALPALGKIQAIMASAAWSLLPARASA